MTSLTYYPSLRIFCLLWSNLTKIYIRSSRTKHQTKRITLRQDTTENQQSCMLFRKTKSSNLLLSTDFLCGQARKWGNFSIHLDHKVQTFAFISKYSNYIECMFTCSRVHPNLYTCLFDTYLLCLVDTRLFDYFFSRNHHQPHRYLLLCNRTYHYHRDFCCIDYYEIRMHENIGYQLKNLCESCLIISFVRLNCIMQGLFVSKKAYREIICMHAYKRIYKG